MAAAESFAVASAGAMSMAPTLWPETMTSIAAITAIAAYPIKRMLHLL
jgi:hypothetical protein